MRSQTIIGLISLAALLSVTIYLIQRENMEQILQGQQVGDCLVIESGIYKPSTKLEVYAGNKCQQDSFFLVYFKRNDNSEDEQSTTCLSIGQFEKLEVSDPSLITNIIQQPCDIN